MHSIEQSLYHLKEGKDISDSSFYKLQAKAKKIGTDKVLLTWKKIAGITTYYVYGSECGNSKKFEKLASVNNNTFQVKNLKKGKFYKFVIVATANSQIRQKKAMSVSKSIHVVTEGNKKYGNFSAVTLSKKKVTLKEKKSITVKAKKKIRNKTVKEHRKLSFESSNTSIATVSAKGKIVGKKKGKCVIYAYVQNGMFAKVSVTVR